MKIDHSHLTRKELGHHMATELSLPFGTDVTGFLTRCTFRVSFLTFKQIVICRQGDDCSNMDYWMNFTHPAYGNCFTFNANGTSEGVKKMIYSLVVFLFEKGETSDCDRVSKWTCA